MKKILVTGGTVFVSKFVAKYFADKGNQVYVLNRNSRPQLDNVILIEGDRNCLGDLLKGYHFDAVLDVTAYTRADVENLVNALDEIQDYVFISSSAVYPETLTQPFSEEQECGANAIWGAYGMNKIEAEQFLQEKVPQAYILRPPYLYGPMENVYRELFVFDCAMEGNPFYVPKDGEMKLQFFHVEDLCRFIEVLLEEKPRERIYNVGNPDALTVNEWVKLCYEAVGAAAQLVQVDAACVSNPEIKVQHVQREYFCFPDYEYILDVARQQALMPEVKDMRSGLAETLKRYRQGVDPVRKRPYQTYIDEHIL